MQQDNQIREGMQKGAQTSRQIQEGAKRAGRVTGAVVGGVVTGVLSALWQTGTGIAKGAIEGGKAGLGTVVAATETSLNEAREAMADPASGGVQCSNCGTGLRPNQKFCGDCGQPA
jgi:hypothetical protein